MGSLRSSETGLKKNLRDLPFEVRKSLIERGNSEISICRQSDLLDIGRSALYYKPHENPEKKKIMDEIDEIYTEFPYYGKRRISHELQRRGFLVGVKRTRSLMQLMGLEAIYPKPKTSTSHPEHKKFPYLLKGVKLVKPNQVWATDITYIRMQKGWIYLVAVIDWFSRFVVSWEISVTLEADFCISALDKAINRFGIPEIFNSDQGVQFTSNDFIALLERHNISISMDGKGRCFDNIFTERFWRSLKQEEVYLKEYLSVTEAKNNIEQYIDRFNHKRLHQALNYQTPAEIYLNNTEQR